MSCIRLHVGEFRLNGLRQGVVMGRIDDTVM